MSDTLSYTGFAGPPEGDELNNMIFIAKQQIARLRTIQLVKVLAVNPGDSAMNPTTVDVQVMVDQIDADGNRTPHGTVYGITAGRWHHGRNALLVDPAVGDVGIIHTADRDTSQVIANNGAQSAPGSGRRHDFSDATYVATLFTPKATNYTDLRQGNHTTVTDGNVSHTTTASGGSHTTTSQADDSPHAHVTMGANSPITHTTQKDSSPISNTTQGISSLISFLTQGMSSPISHGTQADNSPLSLTTQGNESPMSQSTTGNNSPMSFSTSGINSPLSLASSGAMSLSSPEPVTMSAGSAAGNVGPLGGDLSGTLPDPDVVGITHVTDANSLPGFTSNALAIAGGLLPGMLYINPTISGSEWVICAAH